MSNKYWIIILYSWYNNLYHIDNLFKYLYTLSKIIFIYLIFKSSNFLKQLKPVQPMIQQPNQTTNCTIQFYKYDSKQFNYLGPKY